MKFYFKGLFKMAVVYLVIPFLIIPLIVLVFPWQYSTIFTVAPIPLIASIIYWRNMPQLMKAALLWLAFVFFIMNMGP